MTEIWKSLKNIVEYGENYEVSNLGKVRSIDRRVNSRNGGRNIKGKILNLQTDKDGYLYAQLFKNQKQKNYRTHRLVALVFIPNAENKPQVNHKDGNKQNNHVDNLEWATNSENQQHAIRTGLRKGVNGEKNINSKLTEENARKIIELYRTNNYSQKELGKMFGCSDSVVSNVINGKAWSHLDEKVHKRDMSVKSIITDELIKIVDEMFAKGYSKRKIERETGVSRTTVTKILGREK